MSNIEIRWPTVALVVGVCAAVVAIFAFAGPEERVQLLGILAMLGTAGAAVMRAAFGAPEASKPKRIDVPRDDDDDPGAGGEVLAKEPPTVPRRRSQARNTLMLRALEAGAPSTSILAGALTLVLLVGCSPSALRTHATIALVASHTLEVTRADALASCAALRDACAADAACVEFDMAAAGEPHRRLGTHCAHAGTLGSNGLGYRWRNPALHGLAHQAPDIGHQ